MLNFLKLTTLIICCLAFSVDGESQTTREKKFVDTNYMMEIFKSKNEQKMISLLKFSEKLEFKDETLLFMKDLWMLRKDKYPQLSWSSIENDSVRVRICFRLIMANRSGIFRKFLKVDLDEFRSYLLPLVRSNDYTLAGFAAYSIGFIDNKEDIEILFELAKEQREETFVRMILGLSNMCSPEAKNALFRLQKVVSEHNQNQIKKILDRSRKLKEYGICQ